VLTTHTGSLARPKAVTDAMRARLNGEPYDVAGYDGIVREAVADAVRQQVATGIDVVTDGEQSKAGFFTYLRERLTGFNRWLGTNRGGWHALADYDRLWVDYTRTTDANERAQKLAEMEHILSNDVATIPVMFDVVANVQAASLKGPILRTTPDAGISILKAWTWEWTS